MNLKVVYSQGVIYNGQVKGFNLKTISGEKTIRDRHADFISFFDCTKLTIFENENQEKEYYISLGYVHIENNNGLIIAQMGGEDEEKNQKNYKDYQKFKLTLKDKNSILEIK